MWFISAWGGHRLPACVEYASCVTGEPDSSIVAIGVSGMTPLAYVAGCQNEFGGVLSAMLADICTAVSWISRDTPRKALASISELAELTAGKTCSGLVVLAGYKALGLL